MFEKVLKTSHFCPRVFEWNVTGAYLPNAPTINNDYLHEEKKTLNYHSKLSRISKRGDLVSYEQIEEHPTVLCKIAL
jgi:hypothetical protein